MGFDVDDVHSDTGSRHGTVPTVAVLHAAYLGRIGHDERWADSLRELLDPLTDASTTTCPP